MRIPTLLLSVLPLLAWSAEATVTIPNPLGLSFPWDLVHADVPGVFAGPVTARIGAETRPAQVEPGAAAAGATRVWFVATVTGKAPTPVVVADGEAPTALAIAETADAYEVDNGVYRFRVPRYAGTFAAARPIAELPPVLGGVRTSDAAGGFWGRAWFEGETSVAEATTEVLARGPVFALVRVRMRFAEPPAAPVGAGAKDPSEAAPGRGAFYEATLRFVVGDPWVDVTERYHVPGGAAYHWELKDGLAPDTVMWVRWFGYEKFGGNSDMQWAPLQPLPKQRGPFVALRPRWSQMPGGGQDFIVTRGGRTPGRRDAVGQDDGGYAPDAPAVGVVATFPSRWTDPHAQTISCHAEGGDTARMHFPLGSGSRAYAVLCGDRGRFDDTGRLNGLVRRHVDWTLDKQFNDYVLEWPRDPALAGPNILLSRQQLARLQGDWAAGRETPEMAVVREHLAEYRELKARQETFAALEAAAKARDGTADAARAELAAGKDERARIGKRLASKDVQLLRLIIGETPDAPRPPDAGLWLHRRYQDDFLNPTGATRRLSGPFQSGDLFGGGRPFGGPAQAAIGYIFTDPDQWPGWLNGWHPGNPNFHTDKYAVAIHAGAAMLDHPHARRWLEHGRREFDGDIARVLLPPDGVGYECPGYSTYSLGMQLELARVFANCGFGNVVAENPLFKRTGIWHRHLLTPVDRRLGLRHQAPIGDTHRWGDRDGALFGALARFYASADPAFAAEMMAIWKLYVDQGMKGSLMEDLVAIDRTIAPAPLDRLEWGSHAFHGFGAVMRSRFGTADETFVSVKAGAARGHYHNDELSYHFYGAGTPLSLDYNCSYHPRGDHAALHNSMTFGRSQPFTHIGDERAVEAMEQLHATATVGAFATTPALDVVVAERAGDRLTLSPVDPHDARFQYGYPVRPVERIVHRRFTALVKHPPGAKLRDYLVVRDETSSAEAQQLNIHVLARDVAVDGDLIRCAGQWDVDALVYLGQASAPAVDVHRWWYFDETMSGPGARGGAAERAEWAARIHADDGRSLIPPEGFAGTWTVGEYQKWLRIRTAPGTPILWLMYPQRRGEPAPVFSRLADGGMVVELEGEREEIHLGTVPAAGVPGCAVLRRSGGETVALAAEALPPLGALAGLPGAAHPPEAAAPAGAP